MSYRYFVQHIIFEYFCVFRINVEKTLDPRVKPEDDNLKCLFLFVIPAGLKRESIQNYGHFNLFTNEPYFFIKKTQHLREHEYI